MAIFSAQDPEVTEAAWARFEEVLDGAGELMAEVITDIWNSDAPRNQARIQ
jgi:hypothetical protein